MACSPTRQTHSFKSLSKLDEMSACHELSMSLSGAVDDEGVEPRLVVLMSHRGHCAGRVGAEARATHSSFHSSFS